MKLEKNYKNIFVFNKIYTHEQIYNICYKHNLIPTDCIKDDGEITIGLDEEDEPRWEFKLIKKNQYPLLFQLRWTEYKL